MIIVTPADKAEYDQITRERDDLRRQLEEIRVDARRNTLAALKPYLKHMESYCAVVRCDCGLDQIIAAIESEGS